MEYTVKELAALYMPDPHFTVYYDQELPGRAALLRQAIQAYTAGL